MLTRSQIGWILLICFIAEPVHQISFNVFIAGIYECIGMHNYFLTTYSVAGCLTETWMFPVVSFSGMIFYATVMMTGYLISKKSSFILQLIGALLMYAFLSTFVIQISSFLFTGRHAFSFLKDADRLSQMSMPLFGNALRYKLTTASLSYLLQICYAILCYLIVFKTWSKAFRNTVMTFGFVSCCVGWYMWYFVVGPLIFHR